MYPDNQQQPNQQPNQVPSQPAYQPQPQPYQPPQPQVPPPKKQKHTLRKVFISVIILIVIAAAAFAGYRIFLSGNKAADVSSANTAAATAAQAMTSQAVDADTSTKELAKLAVGTKGDVVTEAIEADGTAADGTVTLRITVSGKTAECYGYRVEQGKAIQYNRLNNCTNDPALKL